MIPFSVMPVATDCMPVWYPCYNNYSKCFIGNLLPVVCLQKIMCSVYENSLSCYRM